MANGLPLPLEHFSPTGGAGRKRITHRTRFGSERPKFPGAGARARLQLSDCITLSLLVSSGYSCWNVSYR
jgi:hypothetical protein